MIEFISVGETARVFRLAAVKGYGEVSINLVCLFVVAVAAFLATPAHALNYSQGYSGGNCSTCSWIAADGEIAVGDALSVPKQIMQFDIWVLVGTTAALLIFLRSGWKLSRLEGAIFLIGYVGYCLAVFS